MLDGMVRPGRLTVSEVNLGRRNHLLVLPLFVLYMNRFQIGPEERVLAERFPAEFEAYRSAVRRWV
jgi:protein-S-isoprenylcysteine O-methyltransferase Ste14